MLNGAALGIGEDLEAERRFVGRGVDEPDTSRGVRFVQCKADPREIVRPVRGGSF
jgi:hypothetical protein